MFEQATKQLVAGRPGPAATSWTMPARRDGLLSSSPKLVADDAFVRPGLPFLSNV